MNIHAWKWQEQGNRFYDTVLMAVVGGAFYGLCIGRPILQTGAIHYSYADVLRFRYPTTTILFQLCMTNCFILIIIFLAYVCRTDRQINTRNVAPQPSLSSTIEAHDFTCRPHGGNTNVWIRFLAFVTIMSVEVALTNISLWNAPLEIYVFSRAISLPCLIQISRFFYSKTGKTNFYKSVGPSLLLSVGVALTAYRHDLSWPFATVWCAFLSSLLGAIWPILAENIRSHYIQAGSDDKPSPPLEIVGGPSSIFQHTRILSSLEYVLLISFSCTIVVSVIALLSGEPGLVLRNFYLGDLPSFWILQLEVAFCRFLFLCGIILLVERIGAVSTTFFVVVISASQVPLLTFSVPTYSQQAGMVLCLAATFCYAGKERIMMVLHTFEHLRMGHHWKESQARYYQLFRIIAVLFMVFLGLVGILKPRIGSTKRSYVPSIPPVPLVDAYLGPRPATNVSANVTLLVQQCRGSLEYLEHMPDVRRCIDYLACNENEYLVAQNVDHQNGAHFHKLDTSLNADKEHSGGTTCDGPVILYHIWWTGLPSWRIELFIKSYFYTQHIHCSRLWIWVNVDQDVNAVSHWMSHPNFAKLSPFLETGEIELKEWSLPSRVPIPPAVDPLDSARYYLHPSAPNSRGEIFVADSIVRDASGQEYIQFYLPGDTSQLILFTIASSDAARLIILHLHGGLYLDVDMILLRDMRPLLLPNVAFSERWSAYSDPSLYNNALIALPPNSTISTLLLNGGTRMGLMYHFMILGKMLVKESRNEVDPELGLMKLESAFFDPLMPIIDNIANGRCTVPCFSDYKAVFKAETCSDEWSAYDGDSVPASEDGNNRTMENFFRGAWAYHMHNKWDMLYESGSWIDVITKAHDRFFSGNNLNSYGERWTRRGIEPYFV